ncbi:MAG: phosphodiesterase/alkaline phosphatase D-like protein, partial [Maricaulis maris]
MLGTLKILATGLEPGMTYYYRFRLNDEYSPVGITFSSFKAPGVDYGKLMVEANGDVG